MFIRKLKKLFGILFLSFLSWQAEASYVLAINSGALSPSQTAFIQATEEYLEKRFGPGVLQIKRSVGLKELRDEIQKKEIDYFISTAGFSRLLNPLGVKELLTYADNRFPDTTHALGSVFLVRADSSIHNLPDLKGKHFVTNFHEGFYGYTVPMGELARDGYDPEHFFGNISYIQKKPADLFDLLLKGKADVIALPTCYWEDTFKDKPQIKNLFRPIHVQSTEPCARSTKTYPNWSLSATSNSNPAFTKELVAALLQMPKWGDGANWSILTDFTAIDELFKELQVGSYDILRNFSLKKFVSDYSMYIAFLGLLFLALLLLTTYLYFQLRVRTKLLVCSLNEQIAANEKAHKAQERYTVLQKLGAIGQMSSIIAHDLRQPLGAIQAYVEGLLRYGKKNGLDPQIVTETLEKVLNQNKKAEAIVDRVRTYAKKKTIEKEKASVYRVVEEAVASFRAAYPKEKPDLIEVRNLCGQETAAAISKLEIELALMNLMKNAMEALKSQQNKAPKILITISCAPTFCTVKIEDNGEEIPDDVFARLAEPLSSEKGEGLGLGLAIAKSIAINHGGKLNFAKGEKGGLCVTLTLPLQPKTN